MEMTETYKLIAGSKKLAAFNEATMLLRRPIKALSVATYELIEDIMKSNPSLSMKAAAKELHVYAASLGDNVALSAQRLETYYHTVQWLVDETGGYHWYAEHSFEQHNRARTIAGNNGYAMLQDGRILDVRTNGTSSEKVWTRLLRSITALHTEQEAVEVYARGSRSNRQRTSKALKGPLALAMPHLDDVAKAVERAT